MHLITDVVLLAASLWAWWFLAAPTQLGGTAAFVLVQGKSMEPTLHSGDLVITRKADAYRVGEIVVFATERTQVVHRLIAGSDQAGWMTQGDNNSFVDPGPVPTAAILGRHVVTLPRVGLVMAAARDNPVLTSAALSCVVLIPFIPWRRRRIHPALRSALGSAQPDRTRLGPTRSDVLAAIVLCCSAAPCVYLLVTGGAAKSGSLLWALCLTACVHCGVAAGWLGIRIMRRSVLPEPDRTRRTLAGRVHRAAQAPDFGNPVLVGSAGALRAIADTHRLPVIYWVDPRSGRHEFWVMTWRRGSFLWTPTTVPLRADLVVRGQVPALSTAPRLAITAGESLESGARLPQRA